MMGQCPYCKQSMAGCQCNFGQGCQGYGQQQFVTYYDIPHYIQTIMAQLDRIETILKELKEAPVNGETVDYYHIRKDKYDFMVETLTKIANEDYRGNRSPASIKALETLEYIGEAKDE